MKHLFQRKYLISFFYLIICLVGLVVWQNIPLENTPELNLPSITVNYNWGSTAPEVVEKELTRKVENAATRLRNVTNVESVSSEGQCAVTITFSKGTPVDFRTLELREYLYSVEETLPENVSSASISRQVPDEIEDQQTFMVYTLNGNLPPRDLLEYARRNIKTKLLGLPGLADITLFGVMDPALIVEFEPEKLEKYRLSSGDIMNGIRQKLEWESAGYLKKENLRYSIIIPPGFKNVADIGRFIIQLPNSLKTIVLNDIATVRIDEYPAKTIKRINGDPSLTIEFVKESGADAMDLAARIQSQMADIQEQLPARMHLMPTYDSTEQLREQFDTLKLQALLSGLFVFLVVMVFIRQIKAPLVIIGSVVFSVFLSLSILYLIGYTLNIITLAGITIALGMLIDNAVVVFEQVNPELPESRAKRLEHISRELPNAVVPVLGSTFTTIGIFIPLLFALQELRIFLIPLAIALTITLISSVLIAFTWIPYALVWLTSVSSIKKDKKRKRSYTHFALMVLYWKAKLKWVFIAGLIVAIGIPLFAIPKPDWDKGSIWPRFTESYFENRDQIDPWIGGFTYRFFKDTYFGSPWKGPDEEVITVYIRPPQGTPLSEIDKIVKNYEQIVIPYKQAFSYYEARLSEYYGAYIRFVVNPDYLYNPEPYYFFGEVMYLAARTGNVATSVSGFGDGISTGFGGGSSNYSIQLNGYAYDELLDLANELKRRLQQSRRVKDVDINSSYYTTRDDYYQYKLNLDSETIMAFGLDKGNMISSLLMDLNPENTFGKLEFEEQEMYLLGISKPERLYADDIVTKVRNQKKVNFSIASVGTVTKEKALTEIRRNNQSYERIVEVNYLGNYRMGSEYINGVIKGMPVPIGASIKFGGSFFDFGNNNNRKNLVLVIMLSILSVWMIVSVLLESFKYPMFVILAVPYSFIGIMLGTLANDLSFDRGAISGALLCIGVVVNNAILLYHQKQIESSRGISGLRSWMNVYRKRFKAILITTTTTIAGLIPMLFWGNNEFWENVAIIVIWGLSASTILLFLMTGINAKERGKMYFKSA